MALSLTICVPPSKLIYACLFRAWQYRPKIISLYFLRWMEMQDVQLQSKLFNPHCTLGLLAKYTISQLFAINKLHKNCFKYFNETNITRVFIQIQHKMLLLMTTAVSK